MLLFLLRVQTFPAFCSVISRYIMKNVIKSQNSFTEVDGYKKSDITLIFRTTFLNYAVLILLEGHRCERCSRKRSISRRQWTVNNCRSISEDDDDVLWFWVEWSFTPTFFSLFILLWARLLLRSIDGHSDVSLTITRCNTSKLRWVLKTYG
jgi:hypothetical protein